MKADTKVKFNAMKSRMAKAYGVDSVAEQFTIEPSTAQRLNDKIVEQSTFLAKINLVPVDELSGENILGSASSPVSGRTDTSGNNERVPKNVLGLKSYKYALKQTNADVALKYNLLDAWAKFKDVGERYARYVQSRIANDMEIIGWYGTSAAATTDLTTNTMLQDVNKGWMQYERENLPENVLAEGVEDSGEIRIGAGGDFANLDVLVNDMVQGIPSYMQNGLVALIGKDLIAAEKGALFAKVGNTPTEKEAMEMAMGHFGGLPWETPSNFPSRGLVITSYDNLSIYQQIDSWRRRIVDNPKKDQIEDYSSRNEGYVVECPEKFVAIEFDNVILPQDEDWEVETDDTDNTNNTDL